MASARTALGLPVARDATVRAGVAVCLGRGARAARAFSPRLVAALAPRFPAASFAGFFDRPRVGLTTASLRFFGAFGDLPRETLRAEARGLDFAKPPRDFGERCREPDARGAEGLLFRTGRASDGAGLLGGFLGLGRFLAVASSEREERVAGFFRFAMDHDSFSFVVRG